MMTDREIRDSKPRSDLQTVGYRPRVVVKFQDGVKIPYEDGAEQHFDKLNIGPWHQLRDQFPGIRLRRLFTSATPEKIGSLVDEAMRRDRSYKAPNFLTYFVIDLPAEVQSNALVASLLKWEKVQTAYFDPPGSDPAVDPSNDPRRINQGYLDPAPIGIDAEFAWGVTGGDGAGQDFIDLEQGWTTNHVDLIAHGATLLHGTIRDSSRAHGTSVLGEICAADNTIGCIGIAPNLASVNLVSYWSSIRPDAIMAAIVKLTCGGTLGGVLLLEAQVDVTVGSAEWTGLPIEVLDAEFDTIRLATALGIVVVEAAGNGGNDLDTFADAGGNLLLNRGSSSFRDSVAVMVGAATSSLPHRPFSLGAGNFGSRVDCYAWGENVDTTSSSGLPPYSTTAYTDGPAKFGGTSAAAAIIAGAALALQGIAQAKLGHRFDGSQMRALLGDPATGTASDVPPNDRIGVMPNLRAIIESSASGLAPSV